MANNEILTIKELAAYLRVHQTTLYRLIRDGKLPCFKVGSDFRFMRSAIDEWIQKRQKGMATK